MEVFFHVADQVAIGILVLGGTNFCDCAVGTFFRENVQVLETAPAGPGSTGQQGPLIVEVVLQRESHRLWSCQRNFSAFLEIDRNECSSGSICGKWVVSELGIAL